MSTKEPQSSSNGQLLTNANGDESNSEIHMEEDQPQNESDIDIEEDDEENEATEDGIQGAEDEMIKLYYNERTIENNDQVQPHFAQLHVTKIL